MSDQPQIDLFEAMRTSRSLRRLKPDPIPDDIIRAIIEAGTLAPSGSNIQNWVFMAVTDVEKRAALGDLYRKGADMMGLRGYGQEGGPQAGGDERAARLTSKSVLHLIDHIQEAPLLLILASQPMPEMPGFEPPPNVQNWMAKSEPASVLLAVQNIMLACRAYGLATCPTTVHIIHEDEVKKLLGMPDGASTFMLLPIGYPIDKIGPVRRKPVEEVTFRDQWGNNWPG